MKNRKFLVVLETIDINAQLEGVITNYNIGELHNIQATYRLNEKNYLQCSQFVYIFLEGKGKLSHLLRMGLRRRDPQFDA